jgi:hypothetical protein
MLELTLVVVPLMICILAILIVATTSKSERVKIVALACLVASVRTIAKTNRSA